MPSSKKTPSAAASASVPPSKTSHLFSARKAGDRAPLTHETIAEDIKAFRKAGGRIEVLGTTRALRRIGNDADAPVISEPATPTPARRR